MRNLPFIGLLSLSFFVPFTSQAIAGGRPPLPQPRWHSRQQVELIADLAPYIDRAIEDIARAESEVMVDYYVMGDEHGERLADALIEAQARGVRVRVLVDRYLGTSPNIRKGAKKVFERLSEAKVPIHKARVGDGGDVSNRVIDHNKVIVVDRTIAYTGGANISKVFHTYRDLMVRLKGRAARDVAALFDHDWYLTLTEEAQPGPMQVLGIEPLPRHSLPWEGTRVRVLSTGMGRVTIRGPLLGALRTARQEVLVQVHQMHDEDLMEALIQARNRGVSVRVLLDPTNIDNFIPLIHRGPRGIFNAYAVKTLQDAGVDVRFVRLEDGWDAYHMKLGLIDRRVLFIGSANWDARSMNVLTETEYEIAGGRVPPKVGETFDELWEHRSEPPAVGDIARFVNFLMRKFM